MKFSIRREHLLEPLQLVSGVVERRQTLPVLSNLLTVIESGKLSLTGSDQEVELSAVTGSISDEESGEITLPAKKLMDICRSLPGEASLQIDLKDNWISIKSGRYKSQLATLPAVDFPKVEMEEVGLKASLPGDTVASLLDRTGFAMAQQDVRYFFNGMLVEVENGTLRTVATNGQRLATSSVECETDASSVNQYVVPRKGVQELLRLAKEAGEATVDLHFSTNHLRAMKDGASLITKLIDGSYPDYTRAIPTGGDKVLVVDRKELREALGRIAVLSNEVYRNVKLSLSNGKVQLNANNPQQEEAEEFVNVDYEGDPLEIGFNVSYLIDVLSKMTGERVEICLSDANSAALLTDPDDQVSKYVVSPMML